MDGDSIDIKNIIRQIEIFQQAADRFFRQAAQSKSGNSNFNEGLLKKGNEMMRQADVLIEQNLVPILQGLNPAVVASALAAAGASPMLASQVTQTLNLARAALQVGAITTAEIVAAINVAVPVLLGVVAIALFVLAIKAWLDYKNEKGAEEFFEHRVKKIEIEKYRYRSRDIPRRM